MTTIPAEKDVPVIELSFSVLQCQLTVPLTLLQFLVPVAELMTVSLQLSKLDRLHTVRKILVLQLCQFNQ